MAQTPQKREEIVITRVFNAPRDRVWKAWTEPEQVKKWWGPRGYVAPFSSIDLRVGGRNLNCMRGPDGKDIWSTGVYKEVDPPGKLVTTDSFADEKGEVVPATYYGLGPEFPRELLITLTLDEDMGKTKLTLRHEGAKNFSETDLSNMEQGWNESFDKLAEYLESSESEDALSKAKKVKITAESGKQEIVFNAQSRLARLGSNRGLRRLRMPATKWAMKDARMITKWDNRIKNLGSVSLVQRHSSRSCVGWIRHEMDGSLRQKWSDEHRAPASLASNNVSGELRIVTHLRLFQCAYPHLPH